jgi:hypothetical protein
MNPPDHLRRVFACLACALDHTGGCAIPALNGAICQNPRAYTGFPVVKVSNLLGEQRIRQHAMLSRLACRFVPTVIYDTIQRLLVIGRRSDAILAVLKPLRWLLAFPVDGDRAKRQKPLSEAYSGFYGYRVVWVWLFCMGESQTGE